MEGPLASGPSLKYKNLSPNEAVDMAENCPLLLLMSVFGALYALLVVHARKELKTIILRHKGQKLLWSCRNITGMDDELMGYRVFMFFIFIFL